MARYNLIIFILLLTLTSLVQARISAYEFDNEAQETTYSTLIHELRCLVCQNQNLADSNADLAQDMKRKTYELVKEGKNKQEIADYMVKRYGDFVLYRPPVTSATFLLWSGPFLILIIGLFILMRVIRGRKNTQSDELSEDNKKRAESLLNTKSE